MSGDVNISNKSCCRERNTKVVSGVWGELSGERVFCVCLPFPPAPKETGGARVAPQMAEEFCGISREHSDVEDRQRCGKFPVSVIHFLS